MTLTPADDDDSAERLNTWAWWCMSGCPTDDPLGVNRTVLPATPVCVVCGRRYTWEELYLPHHQAQIEYRLQQIEKAQEGHTAKKEDTPS